MRCCQTNVVVRCCLLGVGIWMLTGGVAFKCCHFGVDSEVLPFRCQHEMLTRGVCHSDVDCEVLPFTC